MGFPINLAGEEVLASFAVDLDLELISMESLTDSLAYCRLAHQYRDAGQYEAAIHACWQGIELFPGEPLLYSEMAWLLHLCGYSEEARWFAGYGAGKFPQVGQLQWERGLLLPIVYESAAEVQFCRDRFAKSLAQFISQTPWPVAEQAAAIYTNFFLQYQGQNDLHLQRQYGCFLHQVMAARFPQWARPRPLRPRAGKIRVGYISHFYHWHTVFRVFHGLIHRSDRTQLEIFCYYSGQIWDDCTELIHACSDYFYQINDLIGLCQQLDQDQLDILVFLDLGMQPLTSQIAALRLAPVQCSLWGHPVTSGLPTIDYYLSNQLMEPENAQEHYSEQLIRLPNLGIFLPQPPPVALVKQRADFGLSPEDVVYLCCQSLFKYLPEYDYLWPAIARQVPQAKFVFVAAASCTTPMVTTKFIQRVSRCFAAYGLAAGDYLVVLPGLPYGDFQQLNLLADVFLDSWGWSGGMTSLDAIACGLPIITCPGELMRSRQSAAILQRIGATDTIAADAQEYVAIASRLGQDSQRRSHLKYQIITRLPNLWEDYTSPQALLEFYQSVTKFQP